MLLAGSSASEGVESSVERRAAHEQYDPYRVGHNFTHMAPMDRPMYHGALADPSARKIKYTIA